jgi:hypothetical protein
MQSNENFNRGDRLKAIEDEGRVRVPITPFDRVLLAINHKGITLRTRNTKRVLEEIPFHRIAVFSNSRQGELIVATVPEKNKVTGRAILFHTPQAEAIEFILNFYREKMNLGPPK